MPQLGVLMPWGRSKILHALTQTCRSQIHKLISKYFDNHMWVEATAICAPLNFQHLLQSWVPKSIFMEWIKIDQCFIVGLHVQGSTQHPIHWELILFSVPDWVDSKLSANNLRERSPRTNSCLFTLPRPDLCFVFTYYIGIADMYIIMSFVISGRSCRMERHICFEWAQRK